MIPHPNILQIEQCALVIIDVQEAFRPVIGDFDAVARRIAIITQGARLLDVPIFVTEQSPAKLGRTAKEILQILPETVRIHEKTAFSSCGCGGFVDDLPAARRQLLLAGLESHICVNQTAHDLIASGHQVHLLFDCIMSRTTENKNIGIDKMRAAGALLASTEMALFEMMRDATHPQFRAIQKLVK